MKPLKRLVLAVPAALLALVSAVGWYAFATPPTEDLPLAPELIAVTSAEGRALLKSSASKTDLGQLERFLKPQSRRGFCGPATGAAVINAALRPPVEVTQTSLFTPRAKAVKSELAVSLSGLTLDQLAAILRVHGLQVRVVHAADSDIGAFRAAAQAALSEPLTFLVVNYDRQTLGQSGAGHISPVGAFGRDADRVLVLDVAAHRYPHTWVPVTSLWKAMNTVDADSRETRGYLLVRAKEGPK